ncbi:MAG: 30S ribosome-binding factor RbfA [bacterium]|nr:30S ribosome-binding factor RbfA [bacterium]
MVLNFRKVRQKRLESEIRKIIATSIETEYKDLFPSLISISQVELTNDLKSAKIYYSIVGDKKDLIRIEQFFKQNKGKFRNLLAHQLTIRFVPEISFQFDASAERSQRIEYLLNQIHQKDKNDVTS